MAQLLLAIKVILMALSFAGLCGLVRRLFAVDGSAAPLAAASWVIILLMLAGMLRVLLPAWRLLYAGGLCAFIYCYAVRRQRIDWMPAAILGLSIVYVFLRFRNAYFTGHDSISHWGIAAKYLLRLNRFPDASTKLIYFPSYPLGTAAFTYYLCRTTVADSGAFLGAQFLLSVISLLPILGLVRRHRAMGFALSLASMLFILMCNIYALTLQVDALMAYMAVGATAAAAANCRRGRQAVRAALPVAVALVFVKSAGIFFSVLTAILLIWFSFANDGRKAGLRTLLVSALAIAAAFAAWQAHFKLAYAGSPSGMHAVSLQSYSETIGGKSPELIRSIAVQLLLRPLHTNKTVMSIALLAGAGLLLRLCGADREVWMPRYRRMLILAAAVYIAWFAMLFLMYLFSMPASEAAYLASIDRYELSSTIYVAGLCLMLAISCLCGEDYRFTLPWRAACAGGVAAFALFLALAPALNLTRLPERLFGGDTSGAPEYACVRKIRRENDIPEGGRYLVFATESQRPPLRTHYLTKYEFFSNDLMLIFSRSPGETGEPNLYYTVKNYYLDGGDIAQAEDLTAVIAGNIDQYDCLLVYDEDPAFDSALRAFLETYEGDTPVAFGY